jgi:hypothetical protein
MLEQHQQTVVQKLIVIFSDFLPYPSYHIDWSSFGNEQQLITVLQDGEILCQLTNRLIPGSIPNYHQTNSCKIKQFDNINRFIKLCKTSGIPERDLFHASDLIENRNPYRILSNILTFIEKIQYPNSPQASFVQQVQPAKSIPRIFPKNNKISISMSNLMDAIEKSINSPNTIMSTKLSEEDPFKGIEDLDEGSPKLIKQQNSNQLTKSSSVANFTEFEISPSRVISTVNHSKYFKKDRTTSYSKDITHVRQEWETRKRNIKSKLEYTKSCMALLDILKAKEMQITKAHRLQRVSVRDIWKLREELANVKNMIEVEQEKILNRLS